MSKIGKKKIIIPKEVKVSINGDNFDIKGPNGVKKFNLNTKLFDVKISQENEISIILRIHESSKCRKKYLRLVKIDDLNNLADVLDNISTNNMLGE